MARNKSSENGTRYYFIDGVRIGEFITEMTGSHFVELTSEQKKFYLENPTATANEVKNCKLNEPYVEPVKTLEEVKSEAIKEIDEYSRMTMGRFVDPLRLSNALCSLLFAMQDTKGELPIYDRTASMGKVETYLRVGRMCHEQYDKTEGMIKAAESVEAVEIVVTESKAYYDDIE